MILLWVFDKKCKHCTSVDFAMIILILIFLPSIVFSEYHTLFAKIDLPIGMEVELDTERCVAARRAGNVKRIQVG